MKNHSCFKWISHILAVSVALMPWNMTAFSLSRGQAASFFGGVQSASVANNVNLLLSAAQIPSSSPLVVGTYTTPECGAQQTIYELFVCGADQDLIRSYQQYLQAHTSLTTAVDVANAFARAMIFGGALSAQMNSIAGSNLVKEYPNPFKFTPGKGQTPDQHGALVLVQMLAKLQGEYTEFKALEATTSSASSSQTSTPDKKQQQTKKDKKESTGTAHAKKKKDKAGGKAEDKTKQTTQEAKKQKAVGAHAPTSLVVKPASAVGGTGSGGKAGDDDKDDVGQELIGTLMLLVRGVISAAIFQAITVLTAAAVYYICKGSSKSICEQIAPLKKKMEEGEVLKKRLEEFQTKMQKLKEKGKTWRNVLEENPEERNKYFGATIDAIMIEGMGLKGSEGEQYKTLRENLTKQIFAPASGDEQLDLKGMEDRYANFFYKIGQVAEEASQGEKDINLNDVLQAMGDEIKAGKDVDYLFNPNRGQTAKPIGSKIDKPTIFEVKDSPPESLIEGIKARLFVNRALEQGTPAEQAESLWRKYERNSDPPSFKEIYDRWPLGEREDMLENVVDAIGKRLKLKDGDPSIGDIMRANRPAGIRTTDTAARLDDLDSFARKLKALQQDILINAGPETIDEVNIKIRQVIIDRAKAGKAFTFDVDMVNQVREKLGLDPLEATEVSPELGGAQPAEVPQTGTERHAGVEPRTGDPSSVSGDAPVVGQEGPGGGLTSEPAPQPEPVTGGSTGGETGGTHSGHQPGTTPGAPPSSGESTQERIAKWEREIREFDEEKERGKLGAKEKERLQEIQEELAEEEETRP